MAHTATRATRAARASHEIAMFRPLWAMLRAKVPDSEDDHTCMHATGLEIYGDVREE